MLLLVSNIPVKALYSNKYQVFYLFLVIRISPITLMNAQTQRLSIAGPAGRIECALDLPQATPLGLAVVAHPHPLFGGTMDNKVVQTLARAFVQLGLASVRFNFRGTGASEGTHDKGDGEVSDLLVVTQHFRAAYPGQLVLAGFSFGAALTTRAAQRLRVDAQAAHHIVLVGLSTRFAPEPVPPGTLVIHGEQDDVALLQDVLDYARPQQLPVVVIPGTGHFFHGQLPLLKALVTRHFGSIDD
jgi:alpha/beta superfamily hydrolase